MSNHHCIFPLGARLFCVTNIFVVVVYLHLSVVGIRSIINIPNIIIIINLYPMWDVRVSCHRLMNHEIEPWNLVFGLVCVEVIIITIINIVNNVNIVNCIYVKNKICLKIMFTYFMSMSSTNIIRWWQCSLGLFQGKHYIDKINISIIKFLGRFILSILPSFLFLFFFSEGSFDFWWIIGFTQTIWLISFKLLLLFVFSGVINDLKFIN